MCGRVAVGGGDRCSAHKGKPQKRNCAFNRCCVRVDDVEGKMCYRHARLTQEKLQRAEEKAAAPPKPSPKLDAEGVDASRVKSVKVAPKKAMPKKTTEPPAEAKTPPAAKRPVKVAAPKPRATKPRAAATDMLTLLAEAARDPKRMKALQSIIGYVPEEPEPSSSGDCESSEGSGSGSGSTASSSYESSS